MKLIHLLLIVFPFCALGQKCDCKSNYEWTKKTFEENDAGFQYIIDTKGKSTYEMHNTRIINKIKSIKEVSECGEAINEWLRFFRRGHIGL